jgi:4-amino-4-deoxychorismate lyase
MSRLIESVKLLDGRFQNLLYHEERMQRSLRGLYAITRPVRLEQYLLALQFPKEGLYKCRIVYDHISRETSFDAYQPKTIRRIKIIHDDDIEYEFKYRDRRAIDRLFRMKGDCDDVLIVKKGKVTDCSFSNIAFRKGAEWFTPVSALLAGTTRQKLIEKNIIHCREIAQDDIRSFDTFKIINAMLEFDSPEIEVSDIVF